MKRILCFFVLLSFILSVGYGQSLLWEIKGKGLKKASYLFGTIHIQDKRVFDYGNVVKNKFDSCEAFAMELLLDEIDKDDMKKSMLMENTSLDQLLSKEEYDALAKLFKEKTGQSIMLFNKMKPFFISSQIMQASMSKDMGEALDLHLLKKAKSQQKKTFGIEKFSTQMAAVNSISLKDQAKMLMDALRDTTKSISGFDNLLEVYLNADLEKMIELSKDTTLPETFNKAFLIDRNVGMAEKISKLIKQQSVFCAIGAAHLGGEKGVIALLKKKGFTVVPVKIN